MLSGCKGTTGPSSINPDTGEPYGSNFPAVTVRDMVAVQHRLLQQIGIRRLVAVVGGSFGGMQVLEWAIRYPDYIGRGIVIAAAASLNAQALAFDIIGRRSITEDPRWKLGNYYASMRKPKLGLGQARRLAQAAGAAGSGAEYLLRTARGLAEHGIHDDYIWTLQHLVAAEIEAMDPGGRQAAG